MEATNKTGKDPERTYTFGDLLKNGGVRYYMDKNAKERLECYAIALEHRILTIDEVRQMEELDEHEKRPPITVI